MSEPQNGAELLARIRPQLREEAANICLRPDLLDAWQEAEDALVAARGSTVGRQRLTGKDESGNSASAEVRKQAKRVQDLEAEIDATMARFVFRAMTRDRYRAVCDKHPPRKDNQLDSFAGFDREAVEDAMVRECLVDPVFDDASWEEFLTVCNVSEWNELRDTVRSVNRGVTEAPKSGLAAQVLDKRGTGSRRPKRGGSVRAGSTGGSPAKSTSTTTPTDD